MVVFSGRMRRRGRWFGVDGFACRVCVLVVNAALLLLFSARIADMFG
jgi:hypothetical protein